MDYQKALTTLGKRDSRKIQRNTYLKRFPDCIKVLYHATYILHFYPDGRVVFYTGGFRTVSTKDRMNNWGPRDIRIWSERGDWYATTNHEDYIFESGMVYKDGTFPDAEHRPESKHLDLPPSETFTLHRGPNNEPTYLTSEHHKDRMFPVLSTTSDGHFQFLGPDGRIWYPTRNNAWSYCPGRPYKGKPRTHKAA